MSKSRITILLGAGSAMPWGGPSTSDITEELIQAFNKPDETNLLALIQNILASYHGCDQSLINFEILIYALELLYEYYWEKGQPNPIQAHSDLGGLFNVVEGIDNVITPLERNYHGANNNPIFQKGARIGGILEQCYTTIEKIVRKYESNYLDGDFHLNSKVALMLKDLNEHFILRSYSVNYDSSLMHFGLDFFNGFDGRDSISNYSRIISDRNINCYYNLHGCIDFIPNMDPDERGYSYRYKNYDSQVPLHGFIANSELRRRIYPSRIISGQQKLIHTLLSPFNAFFNSFRQDCVDSDIIMTAGYSFSDGHINDCISEIMKDNLKTEFYNITKSDSNSQNSDFVKFTSSNRRKNISFKEGRDEAWLINGDGKCNEYVDGFLNYLNNDQWKNLQ